ncbi:MAG: DUF4345 domain-containing protein [Pseudomonadota bacterium]
MSRRITNFTLAGAGATLAFIGGALMFTPRAFLRMSDIVVEQDPSLLSELTAPGGVLLIAGTFMVLAVIRPHFTKLALMIGAIVYGSYGIARLASMAMHGVPSQSLITAAAVELAVAVLLLALERRHNNDV